jgi:hypothetical protein
MVKICLKCGCEYNGVWKSNFCEKSLCQNARKILKAQTKYANQKRYKAKKQKEAQKLKDPKDEYIPKVEGEPSSKLITEIMERVKVGKGAAITAYKKRCKCGRRCSNLGDEFCVSCYAVEVNGAELSAGAHILENVSSHPKRL